MNGKLFSALLRFWAEECKELAAIHSETDPQKAQVMQARAEAYSEAAATAENKDTFRLSVHYARSVGFNPEGTP
jgi:hypothetical protein